MRLTTSEQNAIRTSARQVFGAHCVVRLFGSRTDDTRRGGDIDLHVIAEPGSATIGNEIAFKRDLKDRIGEQRIDVVLRPRPFLPEAIDDIAMRTGIRLL